jgi:multidrug efflux system outer membrane protein
MRPINLSRNMKKIKFVIGFICTIGLIASCGTPQFGRQTVDQNIPDNFTGKSDTVSSGATKWSKFYTDPYLVSLIDSALANNQEMNIVLQDIWMDKNEVMAKKGEILPAVRGYAGSGVDKVGRYTAQGAMEATTEIEPGKGIPEPMGDFSTGLKASWEVDIWRQLRNGRDAAAKRYLATTEVKNFLATQIVAEIAEAYFELLALDNQLEILNQNIGIQTNALEIVKIQKQAARATELAVKKFEAEVLKTRSLKFMVQQQIIESENRINYLVGRFPQSVARSNSPFLDLVPYDVQSGIPIQLLDNRADVRKAQHLLEASKFDVQITKAEFYPKLNLDLQSGINAFNPTYLIRPQSLMYSIIGDLAAPLINRKAIKAKYYNANSKQIQAVYQYERTVLNAFIEVVNQMSKMSNLSQSLELKKQQVDALSESIEISGDLFLSARANYMEVLMTQRDVLEAKFELIETKKDQMNTMVQTYRALGGGWR